MFAVAGMLVLSAAAAYFYFHRAPRLTDKDTIVLAHFLTTRAILSSMAALRQGPGHPAGTIAVSQNNG